MSFFGFDTSGHNKTAPGFSQAHDPFAGLRGDDGGDAIEFEDTYDGLGDQLDDGDDAFNDDTFGGGGASNVGGGSGGGNVGKDFDFFGQTAKVANAIEEEHMRFARQHPTKPSAPVPGYQQQPYKAEPKPSRSGYEKYSAPEPVPDLQLDAALWGVAPKPQPPAPAPVAAAASFSAAAPSSSRKMMSLEEVEAAMRAQAKNLQPTQSGPSPIPAQHYAPPPAPHQVSAAHSADYLYAQPQSGPTLVPSPGNRASPFDIAAAQAHGHAQGPPVTILQRPQSKQSPAPVPGLGQPPFPQQQRHTHERQPSGHQLHHQAPSVKPTQILQNPNRLSGDVARVGIPTLPVHAGHHRQQNSFSHPSLVTHPSQVSQLSEEEKTAFLEQEARRAKRNHKIFMLSKDNGMMTPQDKNFITRIQLQQLVAATGNPNDQGTDDSLIEDFYYQVHTQIRGGQRQHPGQPLNNFAQTYLYQTGSRQGGGRRQQRGPENHMQRMEQQVQRAVEAAKNKPKNKQLVIEGSLGKISFSNAKTPKPLLNIKRPDSTDPARRPGSSAGRSSSHQQKVLDRKALLADVEKVYSCLMKLEDHQRKMPPPLPPRVHEVDPELPRQHMEWLAGAEELNNELWRALKVHEPIGATAVHPFIAFLSCPKGKKAIPRVFRHTTHEQRTTILTMIVVHLDQLDVVRGAAASSSQDSGGDTLLNAAMRENIELFQVAVMGSLFNHMSELELELVTAVLGLITNLNVDMIARTKIGASMLTLVLSRAELLKQKQGSVPQNSLTQWVDTYDKFFNVLEPTLPRLFTVPVNSGQDIYIWQFLAALGIGANQEQQSRLVLGVKDRVNDTVALSKTLPRDLAQPRLQNVNLFMHSIGLDVELLV